MTPEPKWRSVKTGCRVPDHYARLHPERVYDARLILDPQLWISGPISHKFVPLTELNYDASEFVIEPLSCDSGHLLGVVFWSEP